MVHQKLTFEPANATNRETRPDQPLPARSDSGASLPAWPKPLKSPTFSFRLLSRAPHSGWRPSTPLHRSSFAPGDRSSSGRFSSRSEEHTSELQSPCNLVCRLLLEKKKE